MSDQIFQATPVRRPAETFAFTLNSYDLDAREPCALGVRLDTSEQVRVWLAPRDASGAVYSRPEIADFASRRIGPGGPNTEPGGILLASSAQLMSDGSWASKWLQSLSHFPGEAEVFQATCSVLQGKPGQKSERFPDGTPSFQIQYLTNGSFEHLSDYTAQKLDIARPFRLTNYEDLREAAEHLIEAKIGFGVRLSNPFDVAVIQPFNVSIAGGTVVTPQALFERSLLTIKKAVGPAIQDTIVEILPFRRVWAGSATAEHFAMDVHARGRLRPFNTFNERPTTPGVRAEPHFVDAIVAVRLSTSQDPRPYVTHVEPLRGVRPFTSLHEALRYAPTEDYAPKRPEPQPAATVPPQMEKREGPAGASQRSSVADKADTPTTAQRYSYRPAARR